MRAPRDGDPPMGGSPPCDIFESNNNHFQKYLRFTRVKPKTDPNCCATVGFEVSRLTRASPLLGGRADEQGRGRRSGEGRRARCPQGREYNFKMKSKIEDFRKRKVKISRPIFFIRLVWK